MLIRLNSIAREVPDATCVQALLELLKFQNQRVAVEVNGELVTKAAWPNVILKPNDKVEIVSFVGGG